jgi:hypothetical protein
VPEYDTAAELASQLFDPILEGGMIGVWDPALRPWI